MPDPCTEWPWRRANHGRRHPGGCYTRRNLKRLWNQIRRGGGQQTCHPTDPRDPEHGAKPGAGPQECIGNAILVMREIAHADGLAGPPGELGPANAEAYARTAAERGGMTRTGLLNHCTRLMPEPLRRLGQVPAMPAVSREQVHDPVYGRLDDPCGHGPACGTTEP